MIFGKSDKSPIRNNNIDVSNSSRAYYFKQTAIITSKYKSFGTVFVENDKKDTQRSSWPPQNATGVFRQTLGFTGFCY